MRRYAAAFNDAVEGVGSMAMLSKILSVALFFNGRRSKRPGMAKLWQFSRRKELQRHK